jgi:HNH endonuclease
MHTHEQAKVTQLGMSFGSASYRLMRNILFAFVEKTNQNICYRCGKPMSAKDFSIEHKEPWLHVSPALFWDLENIAFSHKRCNIACSRSGTPRFKKMEAPPGTSWCTKHRDFLPIANFQKSRSSWNGLQSHCRECRRDYFPLRTKSSS